MLSKPRKAIYFLLATFSAICIFVVLYVFFRKIIGLVGTESLFGITISILMGSIVVLVELAILVFIFIAAVSFYKEKRKDDLKSIISAVVMIISFILGAWLYLVYLNSPPSPYGGGGEGLGIAIILQIVQIPFILAFILFTISFSQGKKSSKDLRK